MPAVRYGLKTLGKAGVAWKLKQNADDVATEFEGVIKQAGEDSINSAVESLIREHQEAAKNLEALREALIYVAEKNPIIVFIDELDRCKPDFAVSILEHIKHVFDVENVQFVLIANFEQLRDSINHCYGLRVDAQRYLDKFLKFSFRLSSRYSSDNYNFTHVSVMHALGLIDQHETISNTALRQPVYRTLIETLVTRNHLSLREVETLVRYIEIYNILCNGKAFEDRLVFGYGLLQLLGIYYFCFHPEICEKLDRGFVEGTPMADVLGITSHKKFESIEARDLIRTVASLIFLESNTTVDGLDTSDNEDIQAWDEEVRSLFRQGGFPPDKGERVSIITQSVRTLRMTL